jgi:hypothetical protein
MGLVFVSLISTSSLMAANDLQSAQALYVAEGGVEYEQRVLGQNVNWYRSPDPVDTTTRTLGNGSFTAYANIPATGLRARITAGANMANAYTTSRFPASGILQIGDNVSTGNAEFVRYTGTTATTFTGLTRGQPVGTITTVAQTFPRGTNIYPVTTLVNALPANCNSVNITAVYHLKFLTGGTLDIEGEEITYTGSSQSGANMILTGVQRCQGLIQNVSHAAGQPVTPVLNGGDTEDNEAEITSTGTVGAAVRVVKKTIHR